MESLKCYLNLLGVAIATNSASSSDEDTKAVTIRLTDIEIQLYDTVAKSMGLTLSGFYISLNSF